MTGPEAGRETTPLEEGTTGEFGALLDRLGTMGVPKALGIFESVAVTLPARGQVVTVVWTMTVVVVVWRSGRAGQFVTVAAQLVIVLVMVEETVDLE